MSKAQVNEFVLCINYQAELGKLSCKSAEDILSNATTYFPKTAFNYLLTQESTNEKGRGKLKAANILQHLTPTVLGR